MNSQLWRALALLLIFASHAPAAWRISDSQRETSPNELVEHWTTTVENSTSGTDDQATLHFAVFESRAVALRVIDQPKKPWHDLATVMAQTKALAGVNGGYFDPEYRPIGLLIVEGKMIAPLQKARLLSGVLSSAGKKIQILRVSEFSLSQKPDTAVECGPMIVDLGKSVRGLESTKSARRTFAAVGGDKAALGFCSDVTLADLSNILAIVSIPEFKIQRALNLDGGSSSAFWFKRASGNAFSISELKPVRDFVAIVPR